MTLSEEERLGPIFAEFPDAARDALIPILQRVQEEQGYLSETAIARIGHHLRLPASKVFGVATFYNQFRFLPKGKYHVMICR
ncbi:MAG: NAD(P)H-dependent oxidoreductase subunit E, partial [Polyangiaceae bacterium]|nr:NAD(P)H-dependent oxidoreductase subunit E [Polyangiaceae bacterium]